MLPLLVLTMIASAGPPVLAEPRFGAPLAHAHAHNDYAHKRPLHDALDHGFTSVEADVFLVNGKLLVGHTLFDLRKERTLESLYLEPLKKQVSKNKGQVYARYDGTKPLPFFLLIDIKTESKATYAVVDALLQQYSDLLTVCRNGKVTRGAVTVVISGNCPGDAIGAQKVRYAAIDGRPANLDSDAPSHLIPFISASWGSQFRWKGVGEFPEQERKKLKDIVARAHKHGRLVRFWATPERESVWRELRAANVDLINTDKLPELRQFLLRR